MTPRPRSRIRARKQLRDLPRPTPGKNHPLKKRLIDVPLFLMDCFPGDFQEGKRPMKAFGETAHIEVAERPIEDGKRPINKKMLLRKSEGNFSRGCA